MIYSGKNYELSNTKEKKLLIINFSLLIKNLIPKTQYLIKNDIYRIVTKKRVI